MAAEGLRRRALGRSLFDVFPDNPDDPEAAGVRNLAASLQRVRQEGVADAMPVQKYDIRVPDELGGGFEERFWSPLNAPVFGPDGELACIVHRVEDVTEFVRLQQARSEQGALTRELRERAERMEGEVVVRAREVAETSRMLKEANAELARLYERTRELDELKSQFFANVSHELRTPLALILAPAERLLAARSADDPDRRELELVLRNARLLLRRVNDLLDASKLEASRVGVAYAEIDLAEQVRVVGSNLESLAANRGIAYTVRAGGALRAQADPEQLERVLLNLLSNAFKFTPPGGTIRLELRVEPGSDRALVEVADSGPGIAPGQREAVFERFRQVEGDATRRFGGTGLGLSIARELVLLHGGSLAVSDAPEGGALFVIDLPLAAPPGAVVRPAVAAGPVTRAAVIEDEHAGGAGAPAAAAAGPEDRPLVLVIEDNRDMNRLVADCLADGYRVETAFDGREGLARAIALRPRLIVSDVMMPGMSGEELVRAVRQQASLVDVPILILSARADDELRVRLLREGASDYVFKPFSIEELRARADNLVRAKLADERLETMRLTLERVRIGHDVGRGRGPHVGRGAGPRPGGGGRARPHRDRHPVGGVPGGSAVLSGGPPERAERRRCGHPRTVRGA
ncbi:MAG: hybrid sensor histidine kinase/response regulator [Chloroflexi bacterium]|nr:MAG: hybrid sensor histidine kinase/response regulator [Chloroflexota bacterium]